jgi:GntR family transcriptional repressor for pyruvate dehydrogenase complex
MSIIPLRIYGTSTEVGMAVQRNGIHRMKVSDGIVEHITSQIMDGSLKPGDKLPSEREFAVSLNVSRTALREAVRTLSLMNLLSVKQGEGTFVADMVPGSFMKPLSQMLSMGNMNILELIEARRIIEPQASSLCALRATNDEMIAIQGIVSEMKSCFGNLRRFNDLDLEFHIALARGSHNTVLVATLMAIRDALFEQVQGVQNLPGAAERALKYHTLMGEALASRDCKLAENTMLEHLNDVEQAVMSYVIKK